MSTKHVNTAADLVRYGASLKVEYGGCGAAKTMSGRCWSALGCERSARDWQAPQVRPVRDEGNPAGVAAAGLGRSVLHLRCMEQPRAKGKRRKSGE